MAQNKDHWYDGWIYDKIIAPNQDYLFGQIKAIIEPQSTIIDVGCGTGRFAYTIADYCKSILGIDLSKRNIDRANKNLNLMPNSKISFHHGPIEELNSDKGFHFNYALLTYVIHEVNEEERIQLLKNISQVADKIIIGDYSVPRPKGIYGILSKFIEFMAGREHYRNYKSYMANGGIYYLAEKANLNVIYEAHGQKSINHIVVLFK